ncbi:tetratricopeptide repeat protein [Candidatus Uabimicrobium sp. HlEnr_7]|uniref:tetratricopeptide repeat protein n=1 Tax=Candidatus Uabimicrobium helgolandensis TaxID=3095367 RepID=UPI00355792CC
MQFWGWKKSLEDTVKESPTVENYCTLIRSLQTKGDVTKAWEYVEQAKQKFPRSKEVSELYVTMAKNKWRPEIDRLKKLISKGSNSVAFVQLAEIYKELGEEEESLSLCLKAIETNDKDDIPHFIVGQIRLERFYKDFFEKDGVLAREHLEKSVEINPQNYKALIVLARLYIQIGALKKADQKLRDILRFAPEDENIRNLTSVISTLEKPGIEDVDLLLATVEQDRTLFCCLDGGRNQKREMILSPDIFQNALDSLHSVTDILCLLVCDEEGTLIAHYARENVDFSIYYEVSSCIYQNVQNSTRHMDIGKFQRSEVSGPFGCIQMMTADNIMYTAFGSSESRSKSVYQELQKFISKIPILHGS